MHVWCVCVAAGCGFRTGSFTRWWRWSTRPRRRGIVTGSALRVPFCCFTCDNRRLSVDRTTETRVTAWASSPYFSNSINCIQGVHVDFCSRYLSKLLHLLVQCLPSSFYIDFTLYSSYFQTILSHLKLFQESCNVCYWLKVIWRSLCSKSLLFKHVSIEMDDYLRLYYLGI